MGFSYYVLDDMKRQDLEDLSSLKNLLAAARKGHIYVVQSDNQKNQYKINYDIDTAEVDVVDANPMGGVTNFYNDAQARQMRRPIVNMISLLAKINLLDQLYTLEDKKISALISERHFDRSGPTPYGCSKNLKLEQIEKTFSDILKIKYPSNSSAMFKQSFENGKIILDILKKDGQNINSFDKVKQIIKKIKEEINAIKINQVLSSARL